MNFKANRTKMRRSSSQPILKHIEGAHHKGKSVRNNELDDDDIDAFGKISAPVMRKTVQKWEPTTTRGEEFSWEKQGLWRREQITRAAKLEKQLKAKWTLDGLIEEELNRFRAHYNKAMVPTKLKDVAQLIMPKSTPPPELATLTWLGDWRPSTILDLLRHLARSSVFSKALPDSVAIEVINELRIEEAVIDEEMAEIQATCIFHLPFGPNKGEPAMGCVQSEFKKIHRVITKAQNLRLKAMEIVVKKVLSRTDAAQFLVAFAGIQDLVHQWATKHNLRNSPVCVPTKSLKFGSPLKQ